MEELKVTREAVLRAVEKCPTAKAVLTELFPEIKTELFPEIKEEGINLSELKIVEHGDYVLLYYKYFTGGSLLRINKDGTFHRYGSLNPRVFPGILEDGQLKEKR